MTTTIQCELKQKLISSLLSAKCNNSGLLDFKNILHNNFLDFANKESSLANEAEMLLKLQEIEKDLELIAAYPLLHTKHTVAVGGGFSAGKSQFISSFIQNDIELPIGVVTTTAIPTYVFNEEKDIMLGCSNNGGFVDLNSISENFQKNFSHDFIKSFDFNIKDIMPYIMISSKIKHSNICFIDTPGYNPASISDGFTNEDVQTARNFLENTNALIWIIGADANGTISQSDLDFLNSLDLEDKLLYIIYNKADLKSPDDLEDVLDSIEENLEDEDIEFEGISAYSSVNKEELSYRTTSLEKFLQKCDTFTSKQEEIYQRLKLIYDAYKNASLQEINKKKDISKQLHSLSLDVYAEGVEMDKKPYETISTLKQFFNTKTEDENLKELKNIFVSFKESVESIFDKVIEFNFNEDEKQKSKVPKNREENTKLYPLKKGSFYGYVNIDGKWIIEPQFDEASTFKNYGLAYIKQNDKYGFINKKGEIVIEPSFDNAWFCKVGGLAKIEQNGKYGFINAKAEIAIKPKFDDIFCFNGTDFTKIKLNGKYGFINTKGEIVIEPRFDNASTFNDNGLAYIKQNDKYGFINKKGEIVIEPRFDNVSNFNDDNLAKVEKNDRYGFINEKGEIVITPKFKRIGVMFSRDSEQNFSKFGVICARGYHELTSALLAGIVFHTLLEKSELDDKWGLINTEGEWVLQPTFNKIYDFNSLGNAVFVIEEKNSMNEDYGIVNYNGEIIFQSSEMTIDNFENGFARIRKNGRYGYINEEGMVVIKPKFKDAYDFDETGFAEIEEKNKRGVINDKGDVILLPQFDYIDFLDDVIKVRFGNNEGLVSHTGEYLTFNENDLKGVN